MYIDPNSGGMLFQILLVMFGMISGAVLIFSSKIKMGISKIRRSIKEKRDQSDPSDLHSKEGRQVD
jgi:hypothetical protein